MPDPNERKMLFFADSHIGDAELGTRLHQQIEFYAAAAGLGPEDVVVLHGGDLMTPEPDYRGVEARMLIACQAINGMDLADLMGSKRQFPDPVSFMERVPKRERTRDWEQRDRKRRRK